MKIPRFLDFLNEQLIIGNGWNKLAAFMQKYPAVFPNVVETKDGFDVEEYQMSDMNADFWYEISSAEAEELEGYTWEDEYEEDDPGTEPLFNLCKELADMMVKDKELVNSLGLGHIRDQINWVVKTKTDNIRIIPFGKKFAQKNWAATSSMMPFIGKGMDQKASLSKNGWVLKSSKFGGIASKSYLNHWYNNVFLLMYDNPDIFCKVKGFRQTDASYLQEFIDEPKWNDFVKGNPEEADRLFKELRQKANKVLGTKVPDIDINHNVGLDKEGNLKIFDV